ncbi:hypothetical protein [Tsukamurella ocularis]|uniref:hypothetical protein n=1 Tax=Tsukamurella ocularis TaxID=1970234 RepID=UPI00216A9BF1|nr:hypothetical protein [Tsukamurella ocularis]MCS3779268.1 hypothetical protein [Tsukamurella ocularis]MCS3787112.1 hypothetical protein [Tsukamurella ocularis]MCS3852503.1 hypothetical protein [Tsukamurella ocularis]
MGDELIEYWFGDGEGHLTRWTSPGALGSVLLDFDGDGRIDDAMVDLDGDGRADVAALDLDDDGTREATFRDDGSGRWAESTQAPGAGPVGRGVGADARPDHVHNGLPGAAGTPARAAPSACPIPGVTGVQAPGPDKPVRVVPVSAEPGQPARQAVADTDADGAPDVLLFDTDGDGTADGATDLQQ